MKRKQDIAKESANNVCNNLKASVSSFPLQLISDK